MRPDRPVERWRIQSQDPLADRVLRAVRLCRRIDRAIERGAWIGVPLVLAWMAVQVGRGLLVHECFRP